MTLPIYKQEALLVPVKKLEGSDIRKAHKRFTYFFYEEKKCKQCEYLSERHCDICDSCSAFKGARQTSKVIEVKGESFLSLPAGATKKVKKWLTAIGKDDYKIVDKTPDPEDSEIQMKRGIKMVRPLYKYQKKARNTMLEKRRGILSSPPRTGKTLMGAAITCELGLKTLIIASQREWLVGFRDTFIGSKDEEAFTNAKKKQIGFCKTPEDFKNKDICLATFSQFMSAGGKKRLEKIKNLFGLVLIDEVHYTPALQTSRVISRLNPRYMYGLSGTVERKVTKEIEIAHDLVGPILHECDVERLRPKLTVLNTHVKIADPTGGQAGFTYFQGRLQKNKTRRDKIIKEAIRYAEAGHLVLLPLNQVQPILDWTTEINHQMGKGYALPFYGGLSKDQREEFLSRLRKYKSRICVGNISLISTGTNIPRASCIFEILAMNNGPKCGQRLSRILTPFEDKPTPTIVLVIDDSKLVRTIRRAEFWNAIKPRFDPIIGRDDMAQLMSYFKGVSGGQREYDLSEGM